MKLFPSIFSVLWFADLDECQENKDICGGGKCTNTPGAYRCICVGGLKPSDDLKECIGKN